MWFLENGVYSRYFDTYAEAELYCGMYGFSCKDIYPADDNNEI